MPHFGMAGLDVAACEAAHPYGGRMDSGLAADDLSGAAGGWEHKLLEAIDRYDAANPFYDEVFIEVGDRVRSAGEASKSDIAVITFWKRSGQGSWIGELLAIPDEQVRSATREAFGLEDDAAKLNAMSDLPGFASQEAIPTAVLCAYDPVDHAVMDRRALAALADLGLGVGTERGKTLRYLARVRAMRDQLRGQRPALTARDVDKGLFVFGGDAGGGQGS
jgi:hypothetical protein